MKRIFCTMCAIVLLLSLFLSNASAQEKAEVKIGGALRFNYRYKAWDYTSKKINGDMVMDVFKLNVRAKYSKLFLDADYRFYPADFGGHFIHHGFIGYQFDTKSEIHIGINQVPFGILPYASHSWFFNLPYYVGLEDDYDTGIKYQYRADNFDFDLAWYKNAEGGKKWQKFSNGKSGYGVDPARYSYDLGSDWEELGQLNARVAYHKNGHEVGFSAEYGNFIDHTTDQKDAHYSFGVHYHGKMLAKKQLDIKLQALHYNYDNSRAETITMAAYNYTYDVANSAEILSGGLAYTFDVDWGPISSVQVYENYNYMFKGNDQMNDTQMNVIGMLLTAGPIYTYIDYASGKNHDWLGPWGGFGSNGDQYGLGFGEPDSKWRSWFNINVGYYF